MSWRDRDPEEEARRYDEYADAARQVGGSQEREYREMAERLRAFAAIDWSGPNPENGFYPGERSEGARAAHVDPQSWDRQRRMTAVELLRGHLIGHYGEKLPAFWAAIAPVDNPSPEFVSDEDWWRLRQEMLDSDRAIAAQLVEHADRHARRKLSISLGDLSRVYGSAAPDAALSPRFFAANAVDGDLKPEVQARKLEEYAMRVRVLQDLYADLADGLEDKHE